MGGYLGQPDDMVLADRDGVILIDGAAAEDVIAAAEAKMATEGEDPWPRRSDLAASIPQEAYLEYRACS